MPDQPIKIPGNYVPIIKRVADETGVPFSIIAAVIQTQVGWPNTITPEVIYAVADRLAENANPIQYPGEPGPVVDWNTVATNVFGSGAEGWRKRFEDIYGPMEIDEDLRWAYDTNNQSPTDAFLTPDIGGGIPRVRVLGAGAGTKPKIPGLSDDDADAVMAIADRHYLNYLGRLPTTAEYVDLSRKRWTPDTLERHLRAQPFNGTTVGEWNDMRKRANQYAQDSLGRDADEGEINFLVQNGIADPESVSAYYEQLRTRRDSGDPTFAWVGDPETWRATRKSVEEEWRRSGLTGKVDPNLVNEAVTNKWTAADIQNRIRAMPAPGFPVGSTVGDIERVRGIATAVKGDLFPGETVTNSELTALLGATPDDIRNYYRSVVPKGSKTGLPAGIESDVRANANAVLSKFGITGYEPSPDDLKFFANTGADPAMMLEHFASDPKLNAQHPGLGFGMDSTEFQSNLGALQQAYQGVFPGQSLDAPSGTTRESRQSSLSGYALGNRVSPGAFSQTLETFRQERGRAPTGAEFTERFNRADTARPQGRMAAAPIAKPPATRDRGRPRPAVSA